MVSEVICIASGPSLTQSDCDLTRGRFVIAINHSWQRARHADILFAGDGDWWHQYGGEVDIPAARWSCSQATENQLTGTSGWCSGANAIRLACEHGASRVLLLGYDCSLRHGIHWHGPHDKTKNPNSDQLLRWRAHFDKVRAMFPSVEIINCSRYTELTTFPRMSLESAWTT